MKRLPLFLLLSIPPSLASFNKKIDILESEQALTKKQSLALVYGYIRNVGRQLNNHKIIPRAINQLVLKYYFDDIYSLEHIHDLKGHQHQIKSLYYSSEPNILFSASDVINLWVWDSKKDLYSCTKTLSGNSNFISLRVTV